MGIGYPPSTACGSPPPPPAFAPGHAPLVLAYDDNGGVKDIVEKAGKVDTRYDAPPSNDAVVGLYCYPPDVFEIIDGLAPSNRGELEITDVNRKYLEAGKLSVEVMGRGTAWLDTGTHESLLEASHFIETIERRQGLKIACPEEIAYRMGYIDGEQLEQLAQPMRNNAYGQYLLEVLRDRVF